jgi:hypothetical protein
MKAKGLGTQAIFIIGLILIGKTAASLPCGNITVETMGKVDKEKLGEH